MLIFLMESIYGLHHFDNIATFLMPYGCNIFRWYI